MDKDVAESCGGEDGAELVGGVGVHAVNEFLPFIIIACEAVVLVDNDKVPTIQLKAKNDEVRQLIAQRNEERMEQVLGELKAARAVSDVAYAAVVMFTNAYALLNPDREEAVVLVKRMQEDLEYFRRYAMPDPNRSRDTKPDGGDEPQPATPAE